MKHRWIIRTPQPKQAQQLATELKVSHLLAQCLINRGIETGNKGSLFLNPRLNQLADPFHLPDMTEAVNRLFRARDYGEAINIFGDYDVDGVTSTALLTLSMQKLGWKIHYFLPHRMDEGFGLSRQAAQKCLKENDASLILAVDCGSTNAPTIDWLNKQNIDVLVVDHHQIEGKPPKAQALVNPHVVQDGTHDFRELCSVGLAFKLLHALIKEGRSRELPEMISFDIRPYLDLVALGTIADLVPLTGENRILTKIGLDRLNRTQRPGLIALKSVSKSANEIGVYEVGFHLGPRLNAAGRLKSAMVSLELLLADDADKARAIADKLNDHNKERQEMERIISGDVVNTVLDKFNPDTDYVIVEGREHWHLGVVGIVAARVMRKFYRPSIILGGDGEFLRGSGRSIEGVDLVAALRECDNLLLSHGGHAMAAGVGVSPENIDLFRNRLNLIVKDQLGGTIPKPTLKLDAESNLYELTMAQISELEHLQPTGQNNPNVQIVIRDLKLDRPPYRMGKEKQHLKIWVRDEGNQCVEAIIWNVPEGEEPSGKFDLAATPQINEYNGRRSVQLKVLDWCQSDGEME